jgi:SpoVK/Ycf46/Vps4 family AAA+-type ATPase
VSGEEDQIEVDNISLDTAVLVQLGKMAVGGGNAQAKVVMRKLARSLRSSHPGVADEIVTMLRASPVRAGAGDVRIEDPVDLDSRLPLLRREDPIVLPYQPIYTEPLQAALDQLVQEHLRSDALYSAGLAPTRTALFVGPPGVGKTLAARWVAESLNLPLLVLDLSSVMSSFLGRTGGNLRRVFDHARMTPCVLLLDELDAVAKKRDDSSEIGELKRLVTVLLQEIDSWPEGSLMLAATNHSELLDPAVWRRFESLLEFELPDTWARAAALDAYLRGEEVTEEVRVLVTEATAGSALSSLEADVLTARRSAALGNRSLDEALTQLACVRLQVLAPQQRAGLVASIVSSGAMSQRQASAMTGVSRDTIRKYVDQGLEARNA